MSRSEPLSIESLLLKQKQEKEAASKPKFLSKEERAKLAIAKRAEEIKTQREKEESTKKDRETLEREAEDIRRKERGDYGGGRYGSGGGGGRRKSYRHSASTCLTDLTILLFLLMSP